MGYIYKITNNINKKCYIGITIQSLEKRMKDHICAIMRNEGCPVLGAAIKKYGVDNFTISLVIICFDEDLGHYEKEYIKKYNTLTPYGYNILEGGIGGGFKGKTHSEETKQKISNSFKSFILNNPEYRQKISERVKLQMQTMDVRDAMIKSEKWKSAVRNARVGARAHKGGKMSENTKKKISDSLKKYHEITDYSTNKSSGPINGHHLQKYNKEGIFIELYKSITDASRKNNIKRTTLINALKNGEGTLGGYIWKKVPKEHKQ